MLSFLSLNFLAESPTDQQAVVKQQSGAGKRPAPLRSDPAANSSGVGESSNYVVARPLPLAPLIVRTPSSSAT
jgi:hypothetical protein